LGEDAGGEEIEVAAGGDAAHLGHDAAEEDEPEDGLDGAAGEFPGVVAEFAELGAGDGEGEWHSLAACR
jgi:hypothetical protein